MYSSAQRWPRTTIVSEPLIETVPACAIAGAASDIAAVAIARIVVFVCMEQSPFQSLNINLGASGRSWSSSRRHLPGRRCRLGDNDETFGLYTPTMRLLPHDASFFTLFEQQGKKTVEGCRAFLEMVENPTNLEIQAERVKQIE